MKRLECPLGAGGGHGFPAELEQDQENAKNGHWQYLRWVAAGRCACALGSREPALGHGPGLSPSAPRLPPQSQVRNRGTTSLKAPGASLCRTM